MDQAHSGFSPESFDGPMRVRWRRDLGSGASYALIAHGRVFALGADRDERLGVTLYALDVHTGDVLWSRDIDAGPGRNWGGIAYDGGTVFLTTGGGTTVGYDEVTGRVRWVHPWGLESRTLPTAAGGAVFTTSGNWQEALDGLSGRLLWRTLGGGIPAVAGDRVIYAAGCRQIRSYRPATGVSVWSRETDECAGAAGGVPVVHGGRLYVRDTYDDVVVDELSGGVLSQRFGYGEIPAFSSDTVVWHDGETGAASARDLSSGGTLWTLEGLDLRVPPLISGDDVFLAEYDGTLRRLDLRTGAAEWSGDAGGTLWNNPTYVGAPPVGLAAAEGVLVVPAEGALTAYEAKGPAAPEAPALNTEVTVSPPARSDSPIAVFQFNSTQPGSSFECRLDDRAWEECRSPLTTRVADGPHALHVRAVGCTGNADLTPEVVAWDVKADRSPPGPATTKRVDPARSGWVPNGWAGGLPAERWSRKFDALVHTPLIVGERAFVVVDDPSGPAQLFALDLASGSTLWSAPAYPGAWIAYDDGQVFAVADAGLAAAYDAETGVRRWLVQLPRPDEAYYYQSPVATDGALVASGGRRGGQMVSVRQADGELNWLDDNMNLPADPAVGGGRVYGAPGPGAVVAALAWDFATGTRLWTQQAGGGPVVFADGRIWTETDAGGFALDAGEGAITDAYAGTVPAIAHDIAVNASGTYLIGRHASTGAILWTRRVGRTREAPYIAGETVFVLDVESRLQAIDLATGRPVWESVIPGDGPFGWLNTGQGAVLATHGRTVSAFTPDGTPPSDEESPPPDEGSPPPDDDSPRCTEDTTPTLADPPPASFGEPLVQPPPPSVTKEPARRASAVARRVMRVLRARVRRLGIDGLGGRRLLSIGHLDLPRGRLAASILLPGRGVLFRGRASGGGSRRLLLKAERRWGRALGAMPHVRLLLRVSFREPGNRHAARARTRITVER